MRGLIGRVQGPGDGVTARPSPWFSCVIGRIPARGSPSWPRRDGSVFDALAGWRDQLGPRPRLIRWQGRGGVLGLGGVMPHLATRVSGKAAGPRITTIVLRPTPPMEQDAIGAARFGRRTVGPHARFAAPPPLSHEESRHEAAMAKTDDGSSFGVPFADALRMFANPEDIENVRSALLAWDQAGHPDFAGGRRPHLQFLGDDHVEPYDEAEGERGETVALHPEGVRLVRAVSRWVRNFRAKLRNGDLRSYYCEDPVFRPIWHELNAVAWDHLRIEGTHRIEYLTCILIPTAYDRRASPIVCDKGGQRLEIRIWPTVPDPGLRLIHSSRPQAKTVGNTPERVGQRRGPKPLYNWAELVALVIQEAQTQEKPKDFGFLKRQVWDKWSERHVNSSPQRFNEWYARLTSRKEEKPRKRADLVRDPLDAGDRRVLWTRLVRLAGSPDGLPPRKKLLPEMVRLFGGNARSAQQRDAMLVEIKAVVPGAIFDRL